MQQYTVYLYLQTALHVSGGIPTHQSSGAHITLSTVSVIIETVTATCRERDCMGTGYQFLPSHVHDR